MSSPQRLQNLTSDILVCNYSIPWFLLYTEGALDILRVVSTEVLRATVLDKVSFLGSSVLNLSPTEPPVSSRLLNLTSYPVETIITYSKN